MKQREVDRAHIVIVTANAHPRRLQLALGEALADDAHALSLFESGNSGTLTKVF
jgi:hypothetical protein